MATVSQSFLPQNQAPYDLPAKGGPGSCSATSRFPGQMTLQNNGWLVLGFRPAECSQSAHICKQAKWSVGGRGGTSPLHPQDPLRLFLPLLSPMAPRSSLPTSFAVWSLVPQRKPAPNWGECGTTHGLVRP